MRAAPPPRPDRGLLAAVPETLARDLGTLPLRLTDGTLHVLAPHPIEDDALEPLRVRVGALRVEVGVHAGAATALLAAYAHERVLVAGRAGSQDAVGLLDALLDEAIAVGASDVHLDPVPTGVRVRFRVDGDLREQPIAAPTLREALVARTKVRAALDVSERRLPQDGRFTHRPDPTSDSGVDVRVATMPTRDGERVTLRLLAQDGVSASLDALGLPSDTVAAIVRATEASDGLVIVCGPTGSGKTTTLHAALARVAAARRNVVTLEDPVERVIAGTAQTQVEPAIGLTFARGLRHLLRHDPDVILVGEVRDSETAQLAVEAAHTGHLVLASLHAVDAPGAHARLVGLGVPAALLADTLRLVVAQRLLATPCPDCSGGDPACTGCEGTGTRGRSAIAETIAPDHRLRARLRTEADPARAHLLLDAACAPRLREVALARAAAGGARAADAVHATPDAGPD